jgi:hypothetical protein
MIFMLLCVIIRSRVEIMSVIDLLQRKTPAEMRILKEWNSTPKIQPGSYLEPSALYKQVEQYKYK